MAADERLSALADKVFQQPPDPNFDFFVELAKILDENPYNATVVTDILAHPMRRIFLQGVTTPPAGANAPVESDPVIAGQGSSSEYRLYLPGVQSAPAGE
jgi:hypothetical protein